MQNKNVCKIIMSSYSEPLTVSLYVKETSLTVLKQPYPLKQHRIMLITQGEGEFEFSAYKEKFKQGDILFGFKNETVILTEGKDVTCLYIEFEGTRADELIKRFGISPLARKKEGYDGLVPLWEESLLRASENNVDLATESVLLYTFSRFTESTNENNTLVEQIVKLTEENFSTFSLSISEISKNLSYNPKYVSHIFKQRMGINYSEYLTKIRLKHAVALLDFGLDSIKNVALLSGFSDPLYFSTVFKKQIGVSPTVYLKNKKDTK